MAPLAGWDPEEWDRLVRLNLTGVFNGMRAGVPHLLSNGGGAVVNTSSISATRPSAGEAPYSAAKAGVMALTASAALEYGPAIRVNAVAPGMIRTNLTKPLLDGLPDEVERYRRTTPIGRVGDPEDVADVVVFLCSDLARFITGQTLVVDGGMTLHGAGVDGLFDRFFGAGQRR
jgi:NAD(P)-dependent dehydrogenase (short-subunit alcohol dehydrogenase family)